MLDRYHLRYFLAVVEAGTFSGAARQVNVTQPALSIGIAKLERALGGRVFERSSQRVELTEIGARLLAHAQSIDREFSAIESGLRTTHAKRVIRLGVLSTLPTTLIENVIVAYHGAGAPEALELVEGSERDLASRLERGRLDMAVTLLRGRGGRFAQELLFQEGYALAIPVGHRLAGRQSVSAHELSGEVMIVRRHCEVLSLVSRHFTGYGVRPRFSFRGANDDRIMSLVRSGLGITVMPSSFNDPGVARPRLDGFDETRQIGLVLTQGPSAHAPALLGAIRVAAKAM